MARQGGLAGALDLEAGVLDHVEVGLAGLALAGQVVAEEDGVGDVQAERLHRAQVHLAPAGDPHLGVRVDEADHREDAQAALRGEVPLLGERGALEGDQEVDRDGVRAQLAQREHHVDEVLVALAHAGDQAGAGGQARAVRLLHGVHPVRVGVGLGDGPVGVLGGVEVVVVGVGAGRLEPLRLVVGEQAEADADLDLGVGLLDGGHGVGDPVDVAVRRAAAAGHQADPFGAAGHAGAGRVGGLVRLEPGVLEDLGLGPEPLRTVRAVLRAEPALQVHQVVELDPAAEPAAAHLAGRGDHVEQLVVGGGEDGQGLLAGRDFAAQALGREGIEQIHGLILPAGDRAAPEQTRQKIGVRMCRLPQCRRSRRRRWSRA